MQKENDLPIIGVIEPGVARRGARNDGGHVGVIGTYGTINSRAYERRSPRPRPTPTITALACPLFVPLVEEGWLETEATRLIAREYLAPLVDAKIDTLVLGCTHYPLLKRVIGDVSRPRRAPDRQRGRNRGRNGCRTSQRSGLAQRGESTTRATALSRPTLPEQFLRVGQRFLGASIDRVETVTLG